MNLTAVILDDESSARRTLRALLKEYAPAVSVVADAESLEEGISAIQTYKPDVVFLDLNLKGEEGLRLLEYFPEPDFDIIIVSASGEDHRLPGRDKIAFHLLKPVMPSQLKKAMGEVMGRRG